MMSTELEFEDFLRTRSVLKVRMDYTPAPKEVIAARKYQEGTNALLSALRSGSRVRLEAAVLSLELL
jgi:hypothetical protein